MIGIATALLGKVRFLFGFEGRMDDERGMKVCRWLDRIFKSSRPSALLIELAESHILHTEEESTHVALTHSWAKDKGLDEWTRCVSVAFFQGKDGYQFCSFVTRVYFQGPHNFLIIESIQNSLDEDGEPVVEFSHYFADRVDITSPQSLAEASMRFLNGIDAMMKGKVKLLPKDHPAAATTGNIIGFREDERGRE